MNINQLSNHLEFNNIFSNCKKNNDKIDWLKVSVFPNLPIGFIDHYFYKLKSYKLERTQKLDDYIISKYKKSLNWYSLVLYQSLSETIINENINIIKKLNIWSLLFSNQKLSLEFLINNIDIIKNNTNLFYKNIRSNFKISDDIKNKIQFLIEKDL